MPHVWYHPAPTAAKFSTPLTRTGVLHDVVVPSPSSPSRFSPQQYAAPPVVTPQLWNDPALTAANLSPPATGTGVVRPAVVPSPSCPKKLSPQQYAAPPVVTPQVCQTPALSIVKRNPPATGAGLGRYQGDDVDPTPSWPNTSSPQQYAARLVLRPQVCTYPP